MTPLLVIAADIPTAFSDAQIAAFVELVISEGEVNPYYLRERVENARTLVMLYDEGVLVGTAAIKNPEPDYRVGVFDKAASDLSASTYSVELGYVVVAKSHRGQKLSWKLADAALPFVGTEQVFATTRMDNEAMHRVLPAREFIASGKPYDSIEHPGSHIRLFVREKPEPVTSGSGSTGRGPSRALAHRPVPGR